MPRSRRTSGAHRRRVHYPPFRATHRSAENALSCQIYQRDASRRVLLGRLAKSAVCVEIGVWRGDFSEMILQVAHPRELHLVDPWAFVPQFPERWYGGQIARSQTDMDAIFAAVESRFRERPQVRMHRMTSSAASRRFHDGHFDWVYVDGDHSYEGVLSDLRSWWPKVRIGGCVAGDDYQWKDEHGRLSVKAAVEQFAAEMGVAVQVISKGQFIFEVPSAR